MKYSNLDLFEYSSAIQNNKMVIGVNVSFDNYNTCYSKAQTNVLGCFAYPYPV